MLIASVVLELDMFCKNMVLCSCVSDSNICKWRQIDNYLKNGLAGGNAFLSAVICSYISN